MNIAGLGRLSGDTTKITRRDIDMFFVEVTSVLGFTCKTCIYANPLELLKFIIDNVFTEDEKEAIKEAGYEISI